MGIFDRLKRVVKSNLNQMISKAEDPEKMLNQLIVDMNQQLIESKKSVASAIADEKKLERQMNDMTNQSKDWERKAMLALKAAQKEPDRQDHFENLAKQALIQKKETGDIADKYKEQWEAQHESVDKLKNALRGLQQRIEEAQRKKNLLIARARRAEAQKKIQDQISGIADSSAFEAFDKMSSKVDQIEAEADALQQIEGPGSGGLEDEFAALEAGGDADELLAEMKEKLALEDKTKKSSPKSESSSSSSSGSGDVDEMMEDLKRKMEE